MARHKIDRFSAKENKIANYAKSLAHPARIAILKLLIKKKSCFCGNIVNELPLSQSTVSQHLKELKKAGLIQGKISGAKTCYCINYTAWNVAKKSFNYFFTSVPTTKKCN